MTSKARATHTANRVIRVPDGMWAAFASVCERRGVTMTADLLGHIRRTVHRHGDDIERALLAEGETEMEANRSRRGGRPPRSPAAS